MPSKMSYDKITTLVLATANTGKVAEFQQLLEGLPFRLTTLADYPPLRVSDEPFDTYQANAKDKAWTIAQQIGLPVLADDSGLEIIAMDHQPGVQSARFLPQYPDFVDKCYWILRHLENATQRKAQFVCALSLVWPTGHHLSVEATCRGEISTTLRGTQGFGYDPIFIPEGWEQSFSELSSDDKNRVSHRGRAVHLLKQLLHMEDLI